MLEYRKHYNKTVLPMEPSEFQSIELWFQMSPYEFFHVRHDGRDGYAHMVKVLRDSKTTIREEHGHSDCMSRLNSMNRRDLLRFWVKWEKRQGQIFDEDDLRGLIMDLIPICHRYNNVIICDDEYEMTFDDIKDFSKRKLRIRSTQHTTPEYYRPDLLPVYEELVREGHRLLDPMREQLIDGLNENRTEVVARLSPKVINLMRQVNADERYASELREAMEYMKG